MTRSDAFRRSLGSVYYWIGNTIRLVDSPFQGEEMLVQQEEKKRRPVWIAAPAAAATFLMSNPIGNFVNKYVHSMLWTPGELNESAAFLAAIIGTATVLIFPAIVWRVVRGDWK